MDKSRSLQPFNWLLFISDATPTEVIGALRLAPTSNTLINNNQLNGCNERLLSI